MSKSQTNLLKIIAILMMIFHHCFAFPERVPCIFVIDSMVQKLALGCRLCIPIFLTISGYGFGKKIIDSRTSVPIHYCIKKLFQFYCLYWFTMLVTLPYGFVRGGYLISDLSWLEFLGLKSNFNREWWFVGLYALLVLSLPVYSKLYLAIDKKIFFLVSTAIYIFGIVFPKIFTSDLITNWIENFLVYQYAMSIGLLLSDDGAISMYKHNKIAITLSPFIFIAIMLIRSFTIRKIYRLDAFMAAILLFAVSTLPNTICDRINKYFPGQTVTFMWLVHTFFCYYYFQNLVNAVQNMVCTFAMTFVASFLLSRLLNYIYNWIDFTLLKKFTDILIRRQNERFN